MLFLPRSIQYKVFSANDPFQQIITAKTGYRFAILNLFINVTGTGSVGLTTFDNGGAGNLLILNAGYHRFVSTDPDIPAILGHRSEAFSIVTSNAVAAGHLAYTFVRNDRDRL